MSVTIASLSGAKGWFRKSSAILHPNSGKFKVFCVFDCQNITNLDVDICPEKLV